MRLGLGHVQLHCIQLLFTPSYKPDEQPGTARVLSYHLPWAWPEHLHLLEGCECKLMPQNISSCTTIAPEHVTNCKLVRNVFTSPVTLCCKKSLTYVNHRIQYPMSSQLQLDSLLPPITWAWPVHLHLRRVVSTSKCHMQSNLRFTAAPPLFQNIRITLVFYPDPLSTAFLGRRSTPDLHVVSSGRETTAPTFWYTQLYLYHVIADIGCV